MCDNGLFWMKVTGNGVSYIKSNIQMDVKYTWILWQDWNCRQIRL